MACSDDRWWRALGRGAMAWQQYKMGRPEAEEALLALGGEDGQFVVRGHKDPTKSESIQSLFQLASLASSKDVVALLVSVPSLRRKFWREGVAVLCSVQA